MADHNPHAQSLAYLTDQAKVSGYEAPTDQDHVSKNPSDLAGIAEAQVVTNTKPSFKVDPEAAPELQSGPAKKYIDNESGADTTVSFNQDIVVSDAQQHSTNKTVIYHGDDAHTATDTHPMQSYDDFVPNSEAADKQSYGALFAEENKAGNQVREDIFGDIDRPKTVEIVGDDIDDDDDDNDDNKAETEDDKKTTFLSVWQEQHREQIVQRGKDEREAQDKQIESAKQALERFNEERRNRIELKRKEAQGLESDLREDYNAVFKHGTIWQQVAKLVDLKTDNKRLERMRDLLIHLKNKDDKSAK